MTRDSMTVDIVCVGAGVASLSAVLRLMRRLKESPGAGGKPPSVLVIEKGRQVGAHVLSGAILDPEALDEVLTIGEQGAMPVESVVTSEALYRLGARGALRLPWIPPPMRAKGFPLVSLAKFTQYVGQLCEKAGAEIHAGFTVAEFLKKDGRVVGVRIGDKGIDKQGNPKPNFEPGPDVYAKVVVLGEGACGALTEKLIEEHGLAKGANPQTYAIGIKELVELPSNPVRAGKVIHTFGYPHDYFTYGGGFVYCLNDKDVAVGLATALDYKDAGLNPHDLFRAFKRHPLVSRLIAGGKVTGYGAKVIPEGGFHSAPALAADGVLIVGDGAGLLDSLRLKGIHIAIQSGTAAGDTLFECWTKQDFSAAMLQGYPRRFRAMSGWRQMKRVKNVRACFALGAIPGLLGSAMSIFTGGLLPPGRFRIGEDWKGLRPSAGKPGAENTDRELQMDRLSDLFFSGTEHEEDQPSHLKIPDPKICLEKCIPAYGAPCTRFCPAQVYTIAEDGSGIRIDASNCLHCKTCTIKDPFQNIEWGLPEGGGGPRYTRM